MQHNGIRLINDAGTDPWPAISISRLKFAFGKRPFLNGIDLDIGDRKWIQSCWSADKEQILQRIAGRLKVMLPLVDEAVSLAKQLG